MHIVIVTGISGSGKTLALNTLEDHGYYCIDNLPPELLPTLFNSSLIDQQKKIAVGIDIRSGQESIKNLPETIKSIKKTFIETDVVYLFASSEVLKQRYNETRRKHPLSDENHSLNDAIQLENRLLDRVAGISDLKIDTSHSSIYQLRRLLIKRLGKNTKSKHSLSLLFQSFGFKHSIPTDSDYLFDVRCLPNPYWVSELRLLTGLNQEIKDWLEPQENVQKMQQDIQRFLESWIPEFEANQKAYMTVSIGCTGGRHRSVYVTEQLAEYFRKQQFSNVIVHHRELEKAEP